MEAVVTISGATAVSLPILNEAGIAQVSPGNTAVGITSHDPGADTGEPDKYYPTGKRTYARVLPKDTFQGAALAALAKEKGCSSLYILNDKEVYGAGLARNVEPAAKKLGLEVKGNDGVDKNAANYRSLGQKVKSTGTQCFVYSGITANNAVQIFKAYEAKFGEKNPDRYAVYGYESMSLLLDAIKRAGANGDDRGALVDALMSTKDREGVFGKYSIDPNGDITLTPNGVYRIENGAMVFDHTVQT